MSAAAGLQQPSVDYEDLAEDLRALDSPVRLELLDKLRTPTALGDIELRPQRLRHGDNPQRPAARQTVKEHLERLTETGLVRIQQPAGAADRRRYVVDASRLYAVCESLRRLTVQYAGQGATADITGSVPLMAGAGGGRGPRLVLVHGVYEGRPYPLEAEERWIIGRDRRSAICLDYDPYVSAENSAIERRGHEWVLVDLPTSKNGTWLNWAKLPSGGSMPLRPGDFIGAGRSLLSFIPD